MSVAACIPLIPVQGAGSAVVGGMISATVLGVIVVPILFALIVGKKSLSRSKN